MWILSLWDVSFLVQSHIVLVGSKLWLKYSAFASRAVYIYICIILYSFHVKVKWKADQSFLPFPKI